MLETIFIIISGLFAIKMLTGVMGGLSSGNEATANGYFRIYLQILKMRLIMGLFIILIIVFCLWKISTGLENHLPKNMLSSITEIPVLATMGFDEQEDKPPKESSYQAGDIYEYNNRKYRLVDKKKYKLSNLEGRVPEVTLNKRVYYLVYKGD